MTNWLIQNLIPYADQVQDKKVRERYCVLSGSLGIGCNLLLFLLKLALGLAMNSIAILSDAFNNFADMGSSVVSIIGAKLSNLKPDKEHPFGHGRLEYVSALVVAFLIMTVGLELGKNSLAKIFNPEPITLSPVLMVILSLSMLLKVWMYLYNRKMGKAISSSLLMATARDSINDVLATGAVILSLLIGQWVSIPIDGIIGTLVSLLIIYSGFDIAKDTVGVLLGNPPSKELVQSIRALVLTEPQIVGIHDLIVHDYGPGRVMASLHAEVSDQSNILDIHEAIDEMEQRIQSELGIDAVIHMDPIADQDDETVQTKMEVQAIVQAVQEHSTIHDFRMVKGEERTNLIFDMVVPYESTAEQAQEILIEVMTRIEANNPKHHAVVQIDRGEG